MHRFGKNESGRCDDVRIRIERRKCWRKEHPFAQFFSFLSPSERSLAFETRELSIAKLEKVNPPLPPKESRFSHEIETGEDQRTTSKFVGPNT